MSDTPMMIQWHACKKEAKDALLLFRLGDFYEAFYEDAELIAKATGLTLTARQGTPMCGAPFHTVESYIDKLIAKGFKVAVAEQTEDPKQTKGIVKREVVRIVTPGTIVNSNLLSDKKNNFFVSVACLENRFGLSILDLTTSEFRVLEIEKAQNVIDELCRLKPAELLVSKNFAFLKELSFHFTFISNEKEPLDLKMAQDVLTGHFDVKTLDAFHLRAKKAAVVSAGSLLLYLKEELSLNLDHIQSLSSESQSDLMALDRSTMNNLGINESLVEILDETCTPMGGRLLRSLVQHPLLKPEEIEKRQKKLTFFINKKELSKTLHATLSQIRDLERLIMKITAGYAGPRDILGMGKSLSHLPDIKKLLPTIEIFDAEALAQHILNALNESPPLRTTEGEMFRDGFHPELDELRTLEKESKSWIAQYQLRLREETGVKNLKVGYTRAFGYYIEVTRAQSDKLSDTFNRRQTLVNTERFITEELKNFEHKVLTAEERSKAIEAELFEKLRCKIGEIAPDIQKAAKTVADIDVSLSLANIALKNHWTLPIIDESDSLEIIDGRHPVIEDNIGRASFIPNDTILNPEQQMMLITGPNMAGKSTYIRQVAIIVILAQIGSYVPAKSAKIGVIDKVFSRIGASDDIARGQSTFMVEMSETANILNNATSRSLVLLDEIGRGTSTYDGISIAWAVSEFLLTTHRKQAKTLFATHYWELTRLEKEFPHAVNFQTAVQEIDSGIVFLRKIIKGGTDKSYGIHVAKLAGLPKKAIKRAEEMLEELEQKPEDQMSLFISTPQEHPVLTELKKIDILNLTPLMAHHTLCELKEKL